MDLWMEVIFGFLRVLLPNQGWESPPLPEVCPNLLMFPPQPPRSAPIATVLPQWASVKNLERIEEG